jgi:hypothetical protein
LGAGLIEFSASLQLEELRAFWRIVLKENEGGARPFLPQYQFGASQVELPIPEIGFAAGECEPSIGLGQRLR